MRFCIVTWNVRFSACLRTFLFTAAKPHGFCGHTQIIHGDGINKFHPQHAALFVHNTVYVYSRQILVRLSLVLSPFISQMDTHTLTLCSICVWNISLQK